MTTPFGFQNKKTKTKEDFSNQIDITVGRVIKIILDGDDPKAIGDIYFAEIQANPGDISTVNPQANKIVAKPLLSNSKNYPLINELVLIFRLPDVGIKASTSSKSFYYLNILNLWNHPHHNSLPYYQGNLQQTQQKNNVQIELGSTKITSNVPTEIFLGDTFIERSNIHPLKPFEGDNIIEGRWGNSIRLGSTVTTKPPISNPLNNWSERPSTSGDPILILRNGQGEQTEEGSTPVVENINNDDASIYLVSTQKVPLEAATTNYYSYKDNPPAAPNEYSGKQVIVSSGRLVFNSSEDHILLSSAKSISLSSNSGVNVDTSVFTVQSSNIYLGSKNATEPLLLGNQTVTLLNQLIKNLSGFASICSTAVSAPAYTPLAQLNTAAKQLNVSLKALQANLESLKSKDNFTI
jgi:hypothetical protein